MSVNYSLNCIVETLTDIIFCRRLDCDGASNGSDFVVDTEQNISQCSRVVNFVRSLAANQRSQGSMSDLPRSPDFMKPQTRERCRACNLPANGEPVWMVDMPEWEHARCRDWSKSSFPFDRRLNSLRALVRALRHAHDTTVRVGRALSALRARWPERAREGIEDLKVWIPN